MTLAARLPAFTWDRIAPLGEKAGLHPDGAVDLSMGTPVDPVPAVIRDALAAASNAPGYPQTRGTAAVRTAAAGWLVAHAQQYGISQIRYAGYVWDAGNGSMGWQRVPRSSRTTSPAPRGSIVAA